MYLTFKRSKETLVWINAILQYLFDNYVYNLVIRREEKGISEIVVRLEAIVPKFVDICCNIMASMMLTVNEQ
jgi:hypothetical protein